MDPTPQYSIHPFRKISQNTEEVWKKWQNREPELFFELAKKYSADVALGTETGELLKASPMRALFRCV